MVFKERYPKFHKIIGFIKLPLIIVTAFFALNQTICFEFFDALYPSPKLTDYDYHLHPISIYYQVLDTSYQQNNDSIIRAEFNLTHYQYYTPPQQWSHGRSAIWYTYEFPQNFKIVISNQDTITKLLATSIYHFTGYQQEFGGDTMYFSRLTADTTWAGYFISDYGFAYTASGRRIPLKCNMRKQFPDRVRNPMRLKIRFLWNGLIYGDSMQLSLYFNFNNVEIYPIYP